MMPREQYRTARELLGWSAKTLTGNSKVGVMTVSRFAAGHGDTHASIRGAMQHVLEVDGAGFTPGDDGGRRANAASAVEMPSDLSRRHLWPYRTNPDGGMPHLRPPGLGPYLRRSLVADQDSPDMASVWLLDDTVEPAAIHCAIMDKVVRPVLAGKGYLILAREPKPEFDVPTGLAQALDRSKVHPGTGGQP